MTDADRDNPDAETREFLSHPETAEAGRLIMEAVQREGDRGAMLVAGEMLSAFLGDALRRLQPGALEASDLDRLTKGVGPLASWSSRSRVAALVGLISPATLKALDDLREVRNKAAHSEKAFALNTHEVRIRRAFELGPNVSSAVNAMAVETVRAARSPGSATVWIWKAGRRGSRQLRTWSSIRRRSASRVWTPMPTTSRATPLPSSFTPMTMSPPSVLANELTSASHSLTAVSPAPGKRP